MSRMVAWTFASLLLAAIGTIGPARGASSVRYALIVGNNHANSPELPLKDLRHAEVEAARLRDLLIQYGNFDPQRVLLVTGQGRSAVLTAAKHLSELHQRDRRELKNLPTLFAFFFTGHGLSGKLLTLDDPLSGADVASIFGSMDATLALGFFDACFAESIELQGKGALPGFNPFSELPKEVLLSEGRMWFVSSRPEEQSFEDERLGGLFTHYFSESFVQARPDGSAITLDEMWEYARRSTEAHAARYGQTQTPVKIVQNLKTRGPLYFSFPEERDAEVTFEPEVEGTFLLQYQDGALVERISKPKGKPLRVALYEGKLILSRVGPGDAFPSQTLTLAKGAPLRIRASGAPTGTTRSFGYAENPIHEKGGLPELSITRRESQSAWGLDGGYGISLASTSALSGFHRVWIGGAFARGLFSASLTAFFAWNQNRFTDWGYQLNEQGVRLLGGLGFAWGPVRLDLEIGAEPRFQQVDYSDSGDVSRLALWAGAGGRILWQLPLGARLAVQLRGGVGALYSQVIAAGDPDRYWSMCPYAEFGLFLPFGG